MRILPSATKVLLITPAALMVGCSGSYKEYAGSYKELVMLLQQQQAQEVRQRQLDRDAREKAARDHEQAMMSLLATMGASASKTESKDDDMIFAMTAMAISHSATNRANADAIVAISESRAGGRQTTSTSLPPLQPPETAGEFVRSATGLILGVGGITAGILSQYNWSDALQQVSKNAGTHNYAQGDGSMILYDNFNQGSYNSTDGGDAQNSGTWDYNYTIPMEEEGEGYGSALSTEESYLKE